jgi:carotenoid cleavage dioxygenase
MLYDQTTCLNEMMIFDAADIETGPLASAKLPLRIPAGFHGSWVGA